MLTPLRAPPSPPLRSLLPAEGAVAAEGMPPAGNTAYGGNFDGGSYGGGAGGVIGTDHVAQVEGSTAL